MAAKTKMMNFSTFFRKFNQLLNHLRVPYLSRHYPARPVHAGFVFVNGFIAIGILASIGMFFNIPFIFPALGPTAILIFLSPHRESSSPRNVLLGHAIGIACGYLSLVAFGLTNRGSVFDDGMQLSRIFAAATALGATGGLMTLLGVPHPPAGATTLIIALGTITRPLYLLVIEIAVAALVLQAIIINKMAGVEYPVEKEGA